MFTFYYKNTDHSTALETYASQKLGEAIAKYSLFPLKVEVTFVTIKMTRMAHVHLVGDQGELFELSETRDDLYVCVDGLYDKLKRQIRKNKERESAKRSKGLHGGHPEGESPFIDLTHKNDEQS